jgi:hypothetical protein
MENLFYLIVKGTSAAYLLYKAYRFLFGKRAVYFWRFMTPEIKTGETSIIPRAKPEPATYSIVGKSQTVYLKEPPREEVKVIEAAFSEDLQKIPAYEEEADITDNDVDDSPDEDVLSREDRFLPLDEEPGEEAVSTGMTYEQISQALDVVRGKQTDETDKTETARILYEIQGSDVFDFLAAQAENEAMIGKLIKENIDNDGVSPPENARKQRQEIAEFDMDRYV